MKSVPFSQMIRPVVAGLSTGQTLLAATFLAAPFFAAEPPAPVISGAIPFRHAIIDSSPDFTRPAKAVGDMNRDGFIDIVCGGSTGLFWYEYPTWTKHVIDPTRVNNNFGYCVDMQVGDINGDGYPDVVVGDYDATHTVRWYENPGPKPTASGPWKSHVLYTFEWVFNHDVELGDINRDGKLDILLRGPKGQTVLLFQNSPDSWIPVTINQGNLNRELREGSALADMDGDGDLDVVHSGFWLECPANPVKGAWLKHVFAEGWADQIGVTVADMNHDGRPDIVWGEMQQSAKRRVGIFLNEGDSEHWKLQLLGNGGTHNIRVADLGNDGDLDIIGANWSVFIPPVPLGHPIPWTVEDPLEIWENLSAKKSAKSDGAALPLDKWTYIHADANRKQAAN